MAVNTAITGAGGLTKAGTGVLSLSAANVYSGATTVAAGTLRATAANTLSAASAHTVNAGATLDLAGHSQSVASLSNAGTVSLLSTAPGTTLTVNGAYVGNGGTLALGTKLDTNGISDRLVLNGAGATASGTTHVAITNLGGLGAATTGDGIAVVTAQNGATSTASAFNLVGGHVDAGAFQYSLVEGGSASADSWFLRTAAVTPTPTPTPTPVIAAYRAEVALHNALPNVLRQGDLAMLSTLHRRVGDESRPIAGEGADTSGWGGDNHRAWGRVLGGSLDMTQAGAAGVDSHANMSGFQSGVDLYADTRWSAGLYMGLLNTTGSVKGNVGGVAETLAGTMRSDNHYLGAYGTYLNPQGFYTDLVLQYGLHDVSTVAPRTSTAGKASSLTASIEVGQSFALGGGWAIEPQAQLIYNRLHFDNAFISGATIGQDADNQVTGRLGVRFTGDIATAAGRLQPYARVNLWHGFSGTDTTTFTSAAAVTPIGTQIGYTSTELAAGFTLKLTSTTSVYGEVGQMFRTGGSGDARVKSSVQGTIGVKLAF